MHKLIETLQSIENEGKQESIILKFPYLIQEINFLILKINFSTSLKDASPYFDFLDKIQLTVSTLQHKFGVNLPNNLQQFVKDFDLLHEFHEREHLFTAIKKSEFFYSPNYDEMILKYLEEITDNSPIGDLVAQLKFLHNRLMRLIDKIKSCATFNEANQYFNLLENIHHCLALLSFKYDISLDESLKSFVRIFDRIDDLNERKRLYSEIKNNNYHVY